VIGRSPNDRVDLVKTHLSFSSRLGLGVMLREICLDQFAERRAPGQALLI
jgi:hypothetical protein